ncbi:cell division protein FtsA [Candidatus Peregrinibacteria bacterium CG08_land_8_20_14_0_20_41_10]|nr:MAG: cell division protein FtsA [Candidatus Peregrinibacteria bacterium CG08_land_8_20_14_0_20_41_10]
MAKNSLIAGLDIGSSKIRTVIGILEEGKGVPNIIGVGVAPSYGIRKGQVIDVEETINNISSSLEDAERMAGEPVHHVFVGISGTHLETFDCKGAVAVSKEEITEEDVDRVLETAQAISIPNNKKVLKIIPKFFCIDGQKGIRYPVGMVGKKLEVEAHIIAGSTPAIKNIEKCAHEAGVDIDDIIPNNLAAPEAVLSKRQKELGVAVIDIGCGGTSFTVFEEGTMLYTTVIPVGGENVTNDIAIGLRTSIDVAEKLKIEHGSCSKDETGGEEEISLGDFNKNESAKISRKQMIEIIEARYREIFFLVREQLRLIRRDGMLPGGVILTGAAVKIPGVIDLARETLNLPIQIGFPLEANGVVEKVDDPSYVSAVGLLLWGMHFEIPNFYSFNLQNLNLLKRVRSLGGWVRKILP